MGFADDIKAFQVKVQANSQKIFVNVASAAHESIVRGSPVTGAPGQPVDEGTLRNSWQLTFPQPNEALIASGGQAAAYNRAIEDGVGPHGPLTLRSEVGGFHSVALTIAGMPRLIADEAKKVAG